MILTGFSAVAEPNAPKEEGVEAGAGEEAAARPLLFGIPFILKQGDEIKRER